MSSSSSSSSSSPRWKYQFEEINDHVLIDNANDRDDDWSSVPCNCYERLRNKDDPCCYDSSCVNYATMIECSSRSCGHSCKNQRFQRREYAKLDVLEVDGKGHGLFAKEDLVKGQFIREYFGEIVTSKELQRRLDSDKDKKHLYVMQLKSGTFIDARYKGSIGRFINHSCEPNCNVDIWSANGRLRVGIFTTDDIPAGTELSFDYHWKASRYRPLTRCCCGASSCRGYLEVLTNEEKELYTSRKGVWMNGLQSLKEKGADAEWLVNKRIKIWWEGNKEYFEADVTATMVDGGKQMHVVYYTIDGKKQKESLMDGSAQWMLLDESKEETLIKKNKRDEDEDEFFEDIGFQIIRREQKTRTVVDLDALIIKEEKVLSFDVARAILSAHLSNSNASSLEYAMLSSRVSVWKSFIELLRNRYGIKDSVLHSDDLKELDMLENQKIVLIGTRDKLTSALKDMDDGEKRYMSEKMKKESEIKQHQIMQQGLVMTNDWRMLSHDIITNDRDEFITTTLDNMVPTKTLPLWTQIPGVRHPVSESVRRGLLLHLKALCKRMKFPITVCIHSMTLLLRYLRFNEDHGVTDNISVIAATLLLTCKARGTFKPKMLKRIVKGAYCQVYSRSESEVGSSSCDSYVQRVLDKEMVIVTLLRHDLFVSEPDFTALSLSYQKAADTHDTTTTHTCVDASPINDSLEVASLLCAYAPTFWVTLPPDLVSICVSIIFSVICCMYSTPQPEKGSEFQKMCEIGLGIAKSEINLKKSITHISNGMTLIPLDELKKLVPAVASANMLSIGTVMGGCLGCLKKWAPFMQATGDENGSVNNGNRLGCRLPWLNVTKDGAALSLCQESDITPLGKDLYGGEVSKDSIALSNASQVLWEGDTDTNSSLAVSFRAWPLAKEASRESKKAAAAELDDIGFSAYSLHELNIIQQLHYSSPHGHFPNIIIPFGILQLQGTVVLPTLKDDDKPSSSSSGNKVVRMISDDLKKASLQRFLVFRPVLRTLQQLLPALCKDDNPIESKLLSPGIVIEFCRDIMSAMDHCSNNSVFFKWISLDQIYVNTRGQLVLGSFNGLDNDNDKKDNDAKDDRKDHKRKGSNGDQEKHDKKRHKEQKSERKSRDNREKRINDDDAPLIPTPTPTYDSNKNHEKNKHSTSEKQTPSASTLYNSDTVSAYLTTTSPEVIFGGTADAASNTWIASSICLHICTGKPIVKAGKTDEKHVQYLFKVLGTPKALKYKTFDRLPAALVYGRSIIGKNGELEESRPRISKHIDSVCPSHILKASSFTPSNGDTESDGGGIKDLFKNGLHLVPSNRPPIHEMLRMPFFHLHSPIESRHDSVLAFLSSNGI